ncbi:MAG: response regulator [Chloroflexi bacterium]|nr:response regulator [Chloroflexota bacterium]MBT5475574.1 response regulator [Chloroflexota bacterium]MBT6706643.1 response regulator [Chloroflexota bacterium]
MIFDLVMPMMSGVEVCRHVRSMSDVPIVFLSGFEDIDQKIESLLAGGDDFVVKGGSLTELMMRIESNLRRVRCCSHSNKRSISGRFLRCQFRD